jgi:hypothetical protein
MAKAHIERNAYGDIEVVANLAGQTVDVVLPVQFDRPYGRDHKVLAYTVYYQVSNAATFITATYMRGRDFGTGTATTIEADGTNLSSLAYASHTVDVDPDYAATLTKVPTNLQFRITTGLAGQKVYLFGVRVRLQSDY